MTPVANEKEEGNVTATADPVSISTTSMQTAHSNCVFSAPTDLLLFEEAGSTIIGALPESGKFCTLAEDATGLFLRSNPVSVDGHKLVYRRTTARGTDEIVIQNLLMGNQSVHQVNGYLESVFWLPDNQRFLYESFSETGSQVHLYDASAETETLVLERNFLDLYGISPDAKWFVYSAESEGQYDLYIRQIFSDETLRITDDPSTPLAAVWSRDGMWIAITAFSTQPEPMTYAMTDKVYLVNPFTEEEKALPLIKSVYGLRWAPDHSKLAYYVVPNPTPESMQVCIFDLFTQENRCLPGDGRVPAWDPSGRYLAFRSFDVDRSCFALVIYDTSRDVYTETSKLSSKFCGSIVPHPSIWIQIK